MVSQNKILSVLSGGTLVRIFNLALGVSLSALLARALGPSEFGAYAFGISLITLISLPLRGGLPNFVTKETVSLFNAGDIVAVNRMVSASVFLIAIYFIVISLFGVIYLQISGPEPKETYVSLILTAVPIVCLVMLLGGVLKGKKKVVLANIPEQIIAPSALLILVLLSMFSKNRLTAEVALLFYMLSFFASLLFALFSLRKFFQIKLSASFLSSNFRPWLSSLIPLTIFSGLSIANGQIAVLVLGISQTEEMVGNFRVALQFSVLVSFGLTIVNAIAAPYIVALNIKGQLGELRRLLFNTALFSTFVAAPMTIMFFVWGRDLIVLLFGKEYLSAYSPMLILVAGQLVNVTCGSVALVLNMSGHEGESVRGIFCGVLINTVLSILLVPCIGLLGAAIAAAASQIFWNIYLLFRSLILVNVNPSIYRCIKL